MRGMFSLDPSASYDVEGGGRVTQGVGYISHVWEHKGMPPQSSALLRPKKIIKIPDLWASQWEV